MEFHLHVPKWFGLRGTVVGIIPGKLQWEIHSPILVIDDPTQLPILHIC